MDTKFETKPTIEQQFFKESNQTPEAVKLVIAAFKKQHALSGLATTLAKQEGYPVWDKSQVQVKKTLQVSNLNGEGQNEETLVFTPIVPQDSNFVNGFFFSRIVGDSVALHLYRANDYDEFSFGAIDSNVVTAERIILKIMELDESIFGIREFRLTDTLLFDAYFKEAADTNMRTIKIKTDPNSGFNSLVNSNVATFCQQQNCPTSSFAGSQSPTKANSIRVGSICFTCFDFTLTIEDPFVWPPDPDFTGGGGGTGGGSSTPPNTGNCTGVSTCRPGTLIEAGRIPCGGCGPGPIVVVSPDDTPVQIIYDPSFLNTRMLCNLEHLENSNSFFMNLVGSFDGNSGNALYFNIVPSLNISDMWGITRGFGGMRYAITAGSNIESKSNLFQMLTLTHELIHARLYYSLERAGLMLYDSDGNPSLDDGNLATPLVELSGLSESERFRRLIEQYNISCSTGPYHPNNWVHYLMGSANFDDQIFRVKLQNLLSENGNLVNESTNFQNHFSILFGTNWQNRVSEYLSWYGLRETLAFDQFLANENITETQFEEIIDYVRENGNKICQ